MSFSVVVAGQIEAVQIPNWPTLYVKYAFTHGEDWRVLVGQDEGITQQASAGCALSCVMNHPLDIAFKSTNVFGWPQLVVSVYGPDMLGRDVLLGTGCGRVPVTAGSHVFYIPLFVPLASSAVNSLVSSMMGKRPEFFDSRFVSKSEGREVTRVQSSGACKIRLHVVHKDFEKCGFSVISSASREAKRKSLLVDVQ